MKHGECVALVRHSFTVNLTHTAGAVHRGRLHVCGCEIPQLFAMPAACGSMQHMKPDPQSVMHIYLDVTVPRINQDWVPSFTLSHTHLHFSDPSHHHSEERLRVTIRLKQKGAGDTM